MIETIKRWIFWWRYQRQEIEASRARMEALAQHVLDISRECRMLLVGMGTSLGAHELEMKRRAADTASLLNECSATLERMKHHTHGVTEWKISEPVPINATVNPFSEDDPPPTRPVVFSSEADVVEVLDEFGRHQEWVRRGKPRHVNIAATNPERVRG